PGGCRRGGAAPGQGARSGGPGRENARARRGGLADGTSGAVAGRQGGGPAGAPRASAGRRGRSGAAGVAAGALGGLWWCLESAAPARTSRGGRSSSRSSRGAGLFVRVWAWSCLLFGLSSTVSGWNLVRRGRREEEGYSATPC
ncbi:unnamed protein product, partial [Prorocentrum cordatum]